MLMYCDVVAVLLGLPWHTERAKKLAAEVRILRAVCVYRRWHLCNQCCLRILLQNAAMQSCWVITPDLMERTYTHVSNFRQFCRDGFQ